MSETWEERKQRHVVSPKISSLSVNDKHLIHRQSKKYLQDLNTLDTLTWKHTCNQASTNRHTKIDTQLQLYRKLIKTNVRIKCKCLYDFHNHNTVYVSSGAGKPHSLVPSSETIPSPSALFCLSKAFRSRTLDGHTHTHTGLWSVSGWTNHSAQV